MTKADTLLLLKYAEAVLNGKARGTKAVAKSIIRVLDHLGFQGQATRRYTVSTQVFKTLAEAEAKLQEWQEDDDLREGTKVFEITGIIYKPLLKLVKEVK